MVHHSGFRGKSALFSVKHTESCPLCQAELVIRSGRYGRFQRCSRYPECDFIRPAKTVEGHVVTRLEGQVCPLCQRSLVLRQGRYGMFICCEDYPHCTHTESIDKPDETALVCPECSQGEVLQRTSRYGKAFYACSRYPQCKWMTRFIPVAGQCHYCHYPLLIEKKEGKGTRLICARATCGKPAPAE
ncbi:MAG: topoisomerase DNA-binding C4 zinc finger domain-containing protein [Enterobacteriaceae bacterium]